MIELVLLGTRFTFKPPGDAFIVARVRIVLLPRSDHLALSAFARKTPLHRFVTHQWILPASSLPRGLNG